MDNCIVCDVPLGHVHYASVRSKVCSPKCRSHWQRHRMSKVEWETIKAGRGMNLSTPPRNQSLRPLIEDLTEKVEALTQKVEQLLSRWPVESPTTSVT